MSTSRTNASPRGYSLDKLQSCQSRVEVLDATNFLPLSDTNPPQCFWPVSVCHCLSPWRHTTFVNMKVWPLVPTSWTLTFPTFAPELERWGIGAPILSLFRLSPSFPFLSFPQLPSFLHPSLSPISSSLWNVSSAFLTSSTFSQCSGSCFTHSPCCVKEGLSLADSPTTLSIYLRDLFFCC